MCAARSIAQEQRVAGGIAYTLTRRRVRNINLRVRSDGSVAASASRRVPGIAVDAFVASRAGWVQQTQQRLAARREAEEQTPLPDKAAALRQMQSLCDKWYPAFADICPGHTPPKIRVRDMTTRWGSCSLRTGVLTFALRLCTMPPAAQEYVVVHEFCHFAQANHSPAFWAEVARHLPDYKTRRALLRQK